MGIESINAAGSSYQGSGYSSETVPVSEAPEVKQSVNSRQAVNFQTDEADNGDNAKGLGITEASESSIKKAVDDINKSKTGAEAIFGYHEGTNRVTIKIVDKDTKEVKKEYPAEKTLDMIQKVWEMAGIMVDEKR
jgi:flagellar protein FlaG